MFTTRAEDFELIRDGLASELRYGSSSALLAEGDSLALVRRLPDASVSLILTDPPYHSTKKSNIIGDTAFAEDDDFLEWIGKYAAEWRRVLRPNGSLFCFCSSAMSARLELLLSRTFNVLSHVVWTKPNEPGFDGWKGKMKKESLRQWYAHSERVLFAEPAVDGNLHRSAFAHFLREIRKQCGLSAHQLAEITGAYGKVNHGGAISNWETGRNIPSQDQYTKMCEAFLATGKVEILPSYEDIIRVFRVSGDVEFTDVWNFPSVKPYAGKHPAEKPASLLEHAIQATTLPGDIVLDTFAGSCSTALAAVKLQRRAVAIEIDPEWVNQSAVRLQALHSGTSYETAGPRRSRPMPVAPQLGLFGK